MKRDGLGKEILQITNTENLGRGNILEKNSIKTKEMKIVITGNFESSKLMLRGRDPSPKG
jgi:hypothetical protein